MQAVACLILLDSSAIAEAYKHAQARSRLAVILLHLIMVDLLMLTETQSSARRDQGAWSLSGPSGFRKMQQQQASHSLHLCSLHPKTCSQLHACLCLSTLEPFGLPED